MQFSPSVAQTIMPTADVVALIVKAGNALNVSNLFEARLNDGTVVAFIDKSGALSAQTLKINGGVPTGTGVVVLSNSPTITSPNLTGAPTAPTPSLTDNSTKLATTAFVQSAGGLPIGGVIEWPYAAASIPSWSALAYGQPVSRTTYASLHALASAAGYPHGSGDGSTTFNLPDYRGRIGVGKDDMGGSAASRVTTAISGVNGQTLGATGGSEGVTLTTAQIPAHNHGITDPGHSHGVSDPGHRHPIWGPANSGSVSGFAVTTGGHLEGPHGYTDQYDLGTGALTSTTTGVAIVGNGTGISIQNNGGGGAHTNIQPTIIVNKIIRIQ